jgi:hypothetical protein
MFYLIDFPGCFITSFYPLCSPGDIATEIFCKEKVLIEEDHIGLDVEKTEGDFPMAERFKLKRHVLF